MHRSLLILALAATLPLGAQQQPPKPVISPEVHSDNTVTFRFRDPNAHEVMLAREGTKRVAMTKDDDGIWSFTTEALDPDLYGYSFVADGVALIDPGNPNMKPNLLSPQSVVHVPGPSSLPWEVADVPHGTLHHHFYKSGVIGDQRDFYVYTPPAYDLKAKSPYPVLYLLHGFSDDASGWTSVGRAHVIMDNLIAQGKAKPMVIVMTLGYGAPEIVQRTAPGMRDPSIRERNMTNYRKALIDEVIPAVEKNYHVSHDREMRAIAGLSMGGAESLYTGLNELNRFAWVAGFSSGGLGTDYAANFPTLDEKANAKLRLLWVACGTEDGLLKANREFLEFLTTRSVHFTRIETPGAHTWLVWRRNLAAFAPLLFQPRT